MLLAHSLVIFVKVLQNVLLVLGNSDTVFSVIALWVILITVRNLVKNAKFNVENVKNRKLIVQNVKQE